MKNRIVAGLLALFFGGFGVHKFYLRDSGSGIFYLILMFVGAGMRIPISMFLGWIDALVLFTMSEERFDAKYNKKYADRQKRRAQRYEPRSDRRYPARDEYGRPRQQRSSQRGYEVRREEARRSPSRSAQRTPQRAPQRPPRRKRDNPFKKTGISKYKDYDVDGAIEDFNKGLELDPKDIALHFNLACAYSLTEKPEKSFHHLSKAVEFGFKDFEKIKTHDDLAFLRIQEGFEAFAEKGYRLETAKTIPVTDKTEEQTPDLSKDLLQDDILLSQLEKLSELRNKGLLSEKEFIIEKEKLMRR